MVNKMLDKSNLAALICSFCILLFSNLGAEEKISLAVLDFKNNSSIIRFDRLEKAVPEMLKTELSQYQGIVVVERSKIESILSEQALAQTGLIEDMTAQEVGRMVGAQYIITGEINKADNRLRIDAHLIKVTTGQILGEKINGKNEKTIEPMIRLLANNLIYDLTGQGAYRESQKIHNYHSGWGMAGTAVLAATTAVLHFQYRDNYDRYHDNATIGEFDTYYDRANTYHKARNIFLALSGGAALTSFILWQSDKSKSNKVYALDSERETGQKLALGISMHGSDYFVSLKLNF